VHHVEYHLVEYFYYTMGIDVMHSLILITKGKHRKFRSFFFLLPIKFTFNTIFTKTMKTWCYPNIFHNIQTNWTIKLF
jgi:hypothetical protein